VIQLEIVASINSCLLSLLSGNTPKSFAGASTYPERNHHISHATTMWPRSRGEQ